MSLRSTMILSASTAIVGLAGAPPTLAQPDQPAASAGGGLEEIVVTARRKEERAQSIPIAITAFSQADLEKKQIGQVRDLIREVPSLSAQTTLSDSNQLFSGFLHLRGLQGTEIYFADVPIGTGDFNPTTGLIHGLSPGVFYDLDNLEVLKGPQGTLFGKNSIGGLIDFQPKKPTNEFDGYGKVTLGNFNDREFEGAVNVPIVQDKLLVRIAGQSQQRDGYTTDLANGKDLDNRNYYAWRVGVTLRPTDDFENYFLYDGYWQDSNGSSQITKAVNPNFVVSNLNANFQPLPAGVTGGCAFTVALGTGAGAVPGGCGAVRIGLYDTPALTAALNAQQAAGPRAVVGNSLPTIGKDYFYGFTDTATWNLSDELALKNIAAARVFKQLSGNDFNSIGFPILNIGNPVNQNSWGDNSVQYTEEFQIQGKALNDKLDWIAGGYLEFDHPLGDTLLPSTSLGDSSAGTTVFDHFHDSSRSQAVFAHGIYDLSNYVDGLRFTAGYRYTWDYVSVQEGSTDKVDGVTRGANGAPNNCGLPANSDNNCFVGTNAHYSSYGWNVALDDQITPGTLVYVRSSNAYRPGTVNPSVPVDFQQIKPEHVTDVEIGLKSDWDLFGMHARTNADIFHTDYKQIAVTQLVQVVDPTGATHAATETLNAATAELEGGEFEATLVPYKGVEISPHVSYVYAHYGQFPAAFGTLTTAAKPPFLDLPKTQYGVSGTYHLPVDESLGDIALTLSYSWNGQQYTTVTAGEPFAIVPSYENFDLKADWTNVLGQPIDVGAFVSNLTNNTHITGITALSTVLGFSSVTYNEPLTFGFSVKYRFSGTPEAAETATAYTPPPAVVPAPPMPKSYLVFFDFNKSDLTPQATAIVDQAAKNARPAKVTQLTVTGHTDTVGSDAYNMRLSRRRAEAVASQLEKDGIPTGEIAILAKGKRDPLVPTADGVKEPQNRRVQIVFADGPTS